MSVKWEKKEGTNDGKLTFEIQPDKIKEGLDIAFNKVKKSLNVPGFRKGRVPRQIFNKMYGEEALYQDALNALLPEAYANAVSESKIKPVSQPEINVESMEKDSAWVLSAKVTVEPEVELGEYKGLEVMKHSTDVSDKEVADELERRRQQQAELVLKEDEPAAEGDTVVIDFEGKVDGKPFDGGKAENYSLELGSKTFIPGFEDQLVGHKAGDEVEVKVTFPDDYQAKDLQGKDAVFEVKIHEVKQKELPELDDDFAKDIDDDVGDDDQRRQQDGGAHDHGVVARVDGRDKVTPQPRDGEDLFDDEGAGHQHGQHGADVGDDGQNGVAQRVLEQDLDAGNALGAGRAHVVLPHDLQQAGAHQTGDVGRGVDGQRRDRHDVGRRLIEAGGGQQLEVHAERIQQQYAGYETGDGDAAGGKHDDDVVGPFAAVVGRKAAQRDADAQRHRHSDARHLAGDGQLVGDDLVNGAPALL